MICGGSARVSIELLKASPSLVILGGGHVGKALARLGRDRCYDFTVGDDREEYARPERSGRGESRAADPDYDLPRRRCPRGATSKWRSFRAVGDRSRGAAPLARPGRAPGALPRPHRFGSEVAEFSPPLRGGNL